MHKTFLLLLAISSWIGLANANADEIQVTANDDLQHIINNANAGDVLYLAKGRYVGNFVIDKAITLTSNGNATIDANNKGNGITLQASNIRIANLRIVNWGSDLTAQDAGIFAERDTQGLIIENNFLNGGGFGIWLLMTKDAKIYNNEIIGDPSLRSADRGNGIQLSSVTQSHVRGNKISLARDGLYVISSQNNLIEENSMSSLRYGIHYMYSYDNTVQFNYAVNTRAGYALMSSRRLIVKGNVSQFSEDYGFLLNYVTQSQIVENIIDTVWTKPENKVIGRDGKGVFVYNSGYNTISKNLVKDAEIGIHLTAGSEKVKVFHNSFIDNPIQVKYVSNQEQEWSLAQQGNYWSNYLGWDLNGDFVGDTHFEPNDGIDKLMWQYPEMEVIMNSPAVVILRWVQRQFPVLKAPGVKDSHPLMASPHESFIPYLSQESGQLIKALKKQITMNNQDTATISPLTTAHTQTTEINAE